MYTHKELTSYSIPYQMRKMKRVEKEEEAAAANTLLDTLYTCLLFFNSKNKYSEPFVFRNCVRVYLFFIFLYLLISCFLVFTA